MMDGKDSVFDFKPKRTPTQITAFVDEFNKYYGVNNSFLHCWIFHIEIRAAGSSVSQRRYMRSVGIEYKGGDTFFQSRLVITNTDVVHTYAELHATHCLRKHGPICMQ